MKAHGSWTGFVARFYYVTGSIYYVYHWFLILGGLSFLASGTSWFYFRTPVLPAIYLSVALFLISLGISFARRTAKIRFLSHNPGLAIQTMKIDYRLGEVDSADYVRDVTAKVLFPVENYECKFHWTGQGETIGNAIKGVTAVDILDHSASSDDICRVHFGTTLPKGKVHHFIYGITCSNATKPVRPFLGHTVDAPLKELYMCVRPPSNHSIKTYKRQIFLNAKSNLHLWEEIVTIENPNCHELDWNEPNPQHGLYYRISW